MEKCDGRNGETGKLGKSGKKKINCFDGGWLLTTHDADGLRLGGRWGLDGA